MRVFPPLRCAAPAWVAAIILPLLLSACPTAQDDDDTVAPDNPWITEQTDLPQAALSIWGVDSSDIWVAGAQNLDNDTDEVPLLLHRDSGTWESLDTGQWGQAWWVVGDGDEVIWVVGSHGLLVRYDRAAGSFTRIETHTDATFFGAWVAPSGALYVVGGVVGSAVEGPVLQLVEGDVATPVVGLPVGISDSENFFKVWGSADDDVWVISDMGTVLHYDGSTWGRQMLPDAPRLVTVYGSGPDDVVVVGGASRATMFARSGVAWEDISPAAGQPLNGVFVRANGCGFSAGFGNFMMERTDNRWSIVDRSPELTADWHGVWMDENCAPWVVGGNIVGLSAGVVARRELP